MRFTRRTSLGVLVAAAAFALTGSVFAQDTSDNSKETLITNVNIFDGTNETLITGKDVVVGTDTSMKLAKKLGVKVAFGTDLMFDLENRKTALKELASRKKYFSSAEIMIQATGIGGEILALSGLRTPYGKLGVIEEGAMADLLIYSANPLEDVAVATDHETNLKLIIKDGVVVKNDL